MNSIIIISVLFVFGCEVNGRPDRLTRSLRNCAVNVSADLDTQCCGLVNEIRIIPGPIAELDDYPWLALIEFVKNGIVKTPCGGALISGKYVLTAAHCIVEQTRRDLSNPENIRLGEYDISHEGPDCILDIGGGEDCTDGVTRIPIEKMIPHPEYNHKKQDYKNDIALIRMTQLAPYTDFIKPICLPRSEIKQNTGLFLRMGGWGLFHSIQSMSLKQQVFESVVTQDDCQRAYNARITLWRGHICTGGRKIKDFCGADGGIPLTKKNGRSHEIIGIVSFKNANCSADIPTVYTNVFEYISWIKLNISP